MKRTVAIDASALRDWYESNGEAGRHYRLAWRSTESLGARPVPLPVSASDEGQWYSCITGRVGGSGDAAAGAGFVTTGGVATVTLGAG